ncbi:MAG: GAF domain-containing protein [Ignavibacteriota bacterium]|jgi:GAF domain-containing protein|nr:MAG: GAF domain-containing protein [Chlorobiota bacterium]MBE7477454.1 GAF domain-containing protein [Ignavibacteriales bacterium]MBL1122857.1 GAF domain-containing protein [Ignavibacteriota bacterium]MCC7092794.1 GAF domain-containing protein [Ignavibacteriaceae bacterium]MCE7856469.1 GAF domain-containing protein [Ignavibacteria bacterium CHB3]MEB2296544.1 GAF domain-containing protein [Ignavibacteria bacterium]
MIEEIRIDKHLSEEERYRLLVSQIKSLLMKEDNLISNLSNFTAIIKDTFDKISWVGFYLFNGEKLYLGPFQGKVACTNIEIGKGVCGTAARKRETIIVADVDMFPGHIACDSSSKSEIVIPLIQTGKLLGVLDIDSYELNSFGIIDKNYLEEICKFLCDEIFPSNNKK